MERGSLAWLGRAGEFRGEAATNELDGSAEGLRERFLEHNIDGVSYGAELRSCQS